MAFPGEMLLQGGGTSSLSQLLPHIWRGAVYVPQVPASQCPGRPQKASWKPGSDTSFRDEPWLWGRHRSVVPEEVVDCGT